MFLVAPLTPPAAAAAQDAAAPEAVAGGEGATTPPPLPASIVTLEQALARVDWEPARRGPLLVVDPANTGLVPGTHSFPASRVGGGYLLRDVAARFGRKIARVGSVTALAPARMVVFNSKPGKADLLAGASRDTRVHMLLASLSPAQWRLLGGERGLGQGDLSPEQRAVFLSFLPEPFPLQKAQVKDGMLFTTYPAQPLRLSPAQRLATRLRLSLAADLSVPTREGRFLLRGILGTSLPDGTETFAFDGAAADARKPGVYGVALRAEVPSRPKPGGLGFDAPALDAPIPLAPEETAGAAAEGGPAAGRRPLTVGELVRRAGRAAGLELYADVRVADLPVFVRGGESLTGGAPARARAGDVLRALSLALSGTFRAIGPAFVLTDDLEGLAARQARIFEWYEEAMSRGQRLSTELQKRIEAAQPVPYLGARAGDELALTPELMRTLSEKQEQAARDRDPGGMGGRDLPLSALPAPMRKLIRDGLSRLAQAVREGRASGPVPVVDRVRVDPQLRLAYLIRQMGAVDDPTISFYSLNWGLFRPKGLAAAAPPAPLPAGPARRALLIAPAGAEDAGRLVRAAAGALQKAATTGITQVWVQVPDRGGEELLAAAVRAGREVGMPVGAVARLLAAPAPDAMITPAGTAAPTAAEAAGAADLNVLGETASRYARRRTQSRDAGDGVGLPLRFALDYFAAAFAERDWLRADLPANVASLKRRLSGLARTTGLAALILRDTAAPGYTSSGKVGRAAAVALENRGWDFGYTPELRLRFLRERGIDPLDLSTRDSLIDVDLHPPFFSGLLGAANVAGGPEDGGADAPRPPFALDAWNALRFEANARLMAELFAAVRAARADLPVLVRARGRGIPTPFGGAGWYGSWDRGDAPPPSHPETWGQQQSPGQVARAQSRSVWLDAPLDTGGDPLAALRAAQEGYAREPAGWDGLVLDASQMPAEKVSALLEILAAPAQSATTPAATP